MATPQNGLPHPNSNRKLTNSLSDLARATPAPQQQQSDMPIGKLATTECAIPHFDRPASLFEFLSESDFRNVLFGVEIDEAACSLCVVLCCLSMSSTESTQSYMGSKLIAIYFAAHAVGLFWSRARLILSRSGNGDNRNPSSKTKPTTDKTAPCRSVASFRAQPLCVQAFCTL